MSSQRGKQRRYIATLALIAAFILIAGYQLRPSETPEPTISQAELTRLNELSQRKSLEELSSYFASVAADVEGALLWLDEPAVTGINWSADGLVIGPATQEGEVDALTIGGTVPLMPLPDRSGELVSVWQSPVTFGVQTPIRPLLLPDPGSWVVLVGRDATGRYRFVQGGFAGTTEDQCGDVPVEVLQTGLALHRTELGSGIFDMDGNLLGVVVRCGDRIAVATPQSIDAAIDVASSPASQLQRVLGITAAELNQASTAYFEAPSGAWIRSVTVGVTPAALRPGDVITKVNGMPVESLSELDALLAYGQEPISMTLVRNRRAVTVELPAEATPSAPTTSAGQAPGAGIALMQAEPGFPVGKIAPDSPAARAGIAPGDRVLAIDGRTPRTQAQAQSALNSLRGDLTFVELERGEIRYGVLLP